MDSNIKVDRKLRVKKQRTLCIHEILLYYVSVRRVNYGEMKSDQQRVNNTRELNIVDLMYWTCQKEKITPTEISQRTVGKIPFKRARFWFRTVKHALSLLVYVDTILRMKMKTIYLSTWLDFWIPVIGCRLFLSSEDKHRLTNICWVIGSVWIPSFCLLQAL